MQNFMWWNPTIVFFGKGTIPKLAEQLQAAGAKTVLLLYGGQAIFKNGAYTQVTEALSKAGIAFAEVGGVKPNPRVDTVREAIARVKASPVDAIVPVGGGSVFDSAKAIAAGAKYKGDVWDFFAGKAEITDALPIFGVLTASATSSEVNGIAVVSNPEAEAKVSMNSALLFPRVSVIDPSLQVTLPEKQTVNGGVDIIAHVLERVLDGDEGSELMDEQGYALIRSMMRLIPALIENPKDYDARAEYAWAASMAHSGFLSCGRAARGDFSSHRLGHSLSLLFDVPHGASLSVMMPAWARYLYETQPVPFARLGEAVFDNFDDVSDEEKALSAIESLEDFFRDIGAPVTLRELDIREDDIQKLADNAAKGGKFGVLKELDAEDVLEIYKLAY
ncbi:MAG: iron-containing alcohol dehydrogenase [Synergistaceae bacterium]|nr:iron-containing alcohol dehydrogenase [Synergistaceae bacterium]